MKTGYLIKHFVGSFFFFALLFISAGKLYYWQGLVYVSIGLVMLILNYTILSPGDDLLKERAQSGEGTKNWDKIILGISFFITLAMYIIAGLDSGRYQWSPVFHWSLSLLGILLTIVGQLLFLVAQKQNQFFSSTVRIQTERDHHVCETGLYRVVRHPAYLGSILQALGFPLLFSSLWSIIPVTATIILLVTRTYLEDMTLNSELKGYIDYSAKTRNKLIPYVW